MTIQRLVLAATLLACASLPATTPAIAQGGAAAALSSQAPDSRLEIALTLYAGGVTMGKVDMDATVRGDDYRVVSHLQTDGVANAFWKATIQATSSGKLSGKGLTPALYDSFTIRRDGQKQQVSLTYGNNMPKLFAEPAYNTAQWPVKPEEQRNTFDPLSAVMSIVSGALAQNGNACNLTAPVFDGRRRYNVEMKKIRDIDIKLDNGVFQGKGMLCQLRYVQVAGFRPTVLRDKDRYPLINVWMTTVKGGTRDYTVPVRVWAETSYGVIAAVVTNLKVDGNAPRT
jgi:hypothetical protein